MEIQSLPYEEMLVSHMAPVPGNWYYILRISLLLLRMVKVSELTVFSGGSSLHLPAVLKGKTTTIHATSFCIDLYARAIAQKKLRQKSMFPKL